MFNGVHIRVLLADRKGGGSQVASEKKAMVDIPKKYYLIKTSNRLRKVHPRLTTTTNMPYSDLPLFFT